MNRAIKHSLNTRQLILGYIGSTKMHKTICTPPCTLRQPWVNVHPRLNLYKSIVALCAQVDLIRVAELLVLGQSLSRDKPILTLFTLLTSL